MRACITFLAAALLCISLAPTQARAYGKDLEDKINRQKLNSAGVFLRVYHKGSAEKILGVLYGTGLNDNQRSGVLQRAGLSRDQMLTLNTAAGADGVKGAAKAFASFKLDPEDVLKSLCLTLMREYDVRTAIDFVMRREGLNEELLNAALDMPYAGWELGSAPQGDITGTLTKTGDVDLLYLWGTPRQRGYAYGKLMARAIMSVVNRHMLTDAMDGAVGDIPWDAICDAQYLRFVFEPAHMEEVKGMLLALEAELPEKDRIIAKYNRPLKLADLLALQTSGDWAGIFGSVMCARVGDSNLVGRNLDTRYDDNNEIFRRPLWLVIEPDKKTEKGQGPYATLTLAGMISGYVGFSQNGAFAMLQDGDGEGLDKLHCQPRSLLLRKALQRCVGASRFPDELALALEKQHFTRGAIIACGGRKSRPPYVIAEADGHHDDQKGVEFRTSTPEAGKTGLTAANTFETRYREEREAYWKARKEENKDFEIPEYVRDARERVRKLNESLRGKEVVDLDTFFAALKKAERKGEGRLTTVNAFVIEPDKGLVHVKLGKNRYNGAHAEKTATFELEKLFTRP